MKRVLLTICYDGTNYHGWQVQPNGLTVQEVLQNSLERLLGNRPDVTGCSRTDSGVHAREFCLHLDCNDNIPESAFIKGLNSILPDDISVLGVREVEKDFHARYNAKGKTYIYGMYTGLNNPFLSRYFLRLEKEPDIEKMNAFCSKITGKHDFYGFSGSKRSVTDTVRTVKECCVYRDDNKILLKITADGFLYNMVRIIAGTALQVGYSELRADCADDVFLKKDRSLAGKTLAPNGLFLEKVYY